MNHRAAARPVWDNAAVPEIEPRRRARVRAVVAALPLPDAARTVLAETMGPGYAVFDIRDGHDDADLVLAPPCSPQALEALKRAFPMARVVVVEIEDWLLDVSLPGPVLRSLDGGADAYHVARSTTDLAQFLAGLDASEVDADAAVLDAAASAAPAAGAAPSSLSAASVDDLLIHHVADAVARRSTADQSHTDGPSAM